METTITSDPSYSDSRPVASTRISTPRQTLIEVAFWLLLILSLAAWAGVH